LKFFKFLFVAFVLISLASCLKSPGQASGESASWLVSLWEGQQFSELKKTQALNLKDKGLVREYFNRGKYLVETASACGVCHGSVPSNPASSLSGGREVNGIPASNITSDEKTGIGSWSLQQIMNAFRTSTSKDGRQLSRKVHSGYSWLSDRDAKSIALFLLASEPVKNSVEVVSGDLNLNPFSSRPKVKGYVPSFAPSATAEYGRYLTHNVSGCKSCHSPDSPESYELFSGNNSASSGLFSSEKDFPVGGPDIRGNAQLPSFFNQGIKKNGDSVDTELCPQSYFKNLSDVDKQAIALYLKRL